MYSKILIILISIIIAMGVTGYVYYQYNVVPMKNEIEQQMQVIVAQQIRDQEQLAAIAAIQDSMETITKANTVLQLNNQQYETELADYLDIFRRHNISKLASAKPGLVEKRVNKSTEEVFNEIEDISKHISSFND
jgi:flagellar basal body-associated protein FliL